MADIASLILNIALALSGALVLRAYLPAVRYHPDPTVEALAKGIVLIAAGIALNAAIWAGYRASILAAHPQMVAVYVQWGGWTDVIGKGMPAVGVIYLLRAKLAAIRPVALQADWTVLTVAWFPDSRSFWPRLLGARIFRWGGWR